MTEKLPFELVIIIGAARSGTNILRDVVCSFDDFGTWPCDEINPIWRYGNLGWPNDALPRALATKPVRDYIRRSFLREWRRQGCPKFLIEKTCANCLRVEFVRAVFPEARFIHLQRNGADVTRSAMKRWSGEFELRKWSYLLAKLRFVPLSSLPFFGMRFLSRRLGRKAHFDQWGPVVEWMPSDGPLHWICARQWASCAYRAARALDRLPMDRVHHLSYEVFVERPFSCLQDLFSFLDHPVSERALWQAIGMIRRPEKTAQQKSNIEISGELRTT